MLGGSPRQAQASLPIRLPMTGQPQEGRALGPRLHNCLLLLFGAGCPHTPLPAQAKTRHLLSHAALPGLAPLPADKAVPADTLARTLTHLPPGAQAQHPPVSCVLF